MLWEDRDCSRPLRSAETPCAPRCPCHRLLLVFVRQLHTRVERRLGDISTGARRLPRHHITIRVPWHDGGWAGTVCSKPTNNTSCLVLGRIGDDRRDDVETRYAGMRFNELAKEDVPPCVKERGSFMAPFDIRRMMNHPYAQTSRTHGHFAQTPFVQRAYTAACVPFRWMLRKNVEGDARTQQTGLAEEMQLGYAPDAEPDLGFKTPWVQAKDNQLTLLDTFFSAVRPQGSLCFFYAKQTPLSERPERVIVGVGRVTSVGGSTEYVYDTSAPPLRSVLWERNVGHSLRPPGSGSIDGFILPYQQLAELAERDGIDTEELVAFAPNELFESYSYSSELLTDDGAVASLVRCAAVLQRIRGKVEGPWDQALAWIDTELNRLWKARGPFPGLGSALAAFGYEWGLQHGGLVAYDLQLLGEREGESDLWKLLDSAMERPEMLPGGSARFLTPNLRAGWRGLNADRRALLNLLSRCVLTEEQALRFYDSHKRREAGVSATDAELLANPYLLFERDRDARNPIAFDTVDRGVFPDHAIREQYPLGEPSRVNDPADGRRVRSLVVDLLEGAAEEGHTLLPQSWLIERARERPLQPPCPLGDSVLETMRDGFDPVVQCVSTATGETAYQVARLTECRSIISREVAKRERGRKHATDHDWTKQVEKTLGPLPPEEDERAVESRGRQEKAAALQAVFSSRLSVLIGPAGTGKTTLIRMLRELPDVANKGVLLLAPTGKARVRLEERTGLSGQGKTLAQFLIGRGRYDGLTGRYFPNPNAAPCADYGTVVVDECSMLTEEQLAALIDSLRGVERLVLVGDPRQLPPIGAGRPFVDIVRRLRPEDVETRFPRCSAGYAELTTPRRQKGTGRPDVLLAAHFNGQPLDPAADAALSDGHADETLRLVRWDRADELEERLVDELARALELLDSKDELGFEESLGGLRFGQAPHAFFHHKTAKSPGAASKVENWQILAPLRAGIMGVDALNRSLQERFRGQVRKLAEAERWRKVPTPFGSQGILYGDKVINVRNQRRKDVFPQEREPYIANGDIGVVVGQYKGREAKYRGSPWKIEVEFAGQLGRKYGFWKGEFGDDRMPTLELAYCLTVHKTQGSEFGTTFVVLTNPCRLLSRELLYTALTRHQDRLVVLHQGAIENYRGFADAEHSEIARRMTNLFTPPSPVKVATASASRFLEDGLIHRTERGDLVRSKSELVIADKLYAAGVEYAYEKPLLISGRARYPDFTIEDDASGVTYYWEHLDLLGDSAYQARWKRKREEYLKEGMEPWTPWVEAEHVLIETWDDFGGGLDAQKIAERVRSIF